MTREDILEFINKNRIFCLRKGEDKIPEFCGLMVFKANPEGVFFNTGKNKKLFQQLYFNPFVELYFQDYDKDCQIQLSGYVELINDERIKDELIQLFPYLKPWSQKSEHNVLAMYCLKKGTVTVYKTGGNVNKKELFSF